MLCKKTRLNKIFAAESTFIRFLFSWFGFKDMNRQCFLCVESAFTSLATEFSLIFRYLRAIATISVFDGKFDAWFLNIERNLFIFVLALGTMRKVDFMGSQHT